MVLIKKSASVIENEYKRVFIRFLKELKLVPYWYKYTNTDRYLKYAKSYTRGLYRDRTTAWYDRNTCMKILGICDFSRFLHEEGVAITSTYDMLAAFLAIFWKEEFLKWRNDMRIRDTVADRIEIGKKHNLEMVNNWLKLKDILG